MFKKLQFLPTVAAAVFLLGACNSSTSTNENKDTTASSITADQSTSDSISGDNHSQHDTVATGNDLMSAMVPSMSKMQSMQMSGDFDIDFANMMIHHHQGALDMAQVELTQGKDEKMKAKAQEIITKQQKEQQELRDFVQSYKASGMKHGEGELQKSMQTMMDKMKSMQMSGNVDKDFATMMISHHEDGISMAKLEVKNGMADKLKQMAKKGIADQQKDISELKSFLSSIK